MTFAFNTFLKKSTIMGGKIMRVFVSTSIMRAAFSKRVIFKIKENNNFF